MRIFETYPEDVSILEDEPYPDLHFTLIGQSFLPLHEDVQLCVMSPFENFEEMKVETPATYLKNSTIQCRAPKSLVK